MCKNLLKRVILLSLKQNRALTKTFPVKIGPQRFTQVGRPGPGRDDSGRNDPDSVNVQFCYFVYPTQNAYPSKPHLSTSQTQPYPGISSSLPWLETYSYHSLPGLGTYLTSTISDKYSRYLGCPPYPTTTCLTLLYLNPPHTTITHLTPALPYLTLFQGID